MASSVEEKRKSSTKKFLETVIEDVENARERIKEFVRKTALNRSVWLSDENAGTHVYLKMESEQITGSFKARGAFNEISIIKKMNESQTEENQYSITTASSGNHGLGCALAMKLLGVQGTIVVAEGTSKDKMEKIRKYGGKLEVFGDDFLDADNRSKQHVQESKNVVYASSYCDASGIHGQGTIGIEILEDLPNVDVVFLSVGSGGFASGIATYMKAVKPSVQIIGCQPLNSCVMYESCKAGKVLDLPSLPTLSDGTAGKIAFETFTFGLCCEFVDKWVLVSEEEISEAMYFMLQKEHKLVEGAAAVCVAALKREKENYRGKNIVLLICGSNVGIDVIKNVIEMNQNKSS